MKRMKRLESTMSISVGKLQGVLGRSNTIQNLRRKARPPSISLNSSLGDLNAKTCKARTQRVLLRFFRYLATSAWFSAATTILTIYALFGDDMRLLFSRKPADWIFDCVTIAAMTIFSIEIVVCTVGKAGYLFGFFFWLDLMSTVTLVLDITVVSEAFFGDSVSKAAVETQSSGGSSGGEENDSSEAARAARMSRAGTKAGRVVRLIRLMRLIRLVKVFKKNKTEYQQVESPGDDWDDDEYRAVEKESAVSKKLSEMTTRRVIMLVLSIMLTLPFFQADMYKDKLPNAAQYGVDTIYRRFRDDVKHFGLDSNHPRSQEYYASLDRENYVEDFMAFIYYHNWFCSLQDVPSDKDASPSSSFGMLFWIGGSPARAPEAKYFMPGVNGTVIGHRDINARFNGSEWSYYQCNLPEQVQSLLSRPWSEASDCLSGKIAGFSFIEYREPEVSCPSDLRYQERIIISPGVVHKDDVGGFSFLFVFDRRRGSRMEAALNAGQTVFICLLLGVGAMTFSKDANTLVLTPIERMISKLEKIRNNPIAAMSIGDEEQHREQVAAFRKHRNNSANFGEVFSESNLSVMRSQLHQPWWITRKCRALKECFCYPYKRFCTSSLKHAPEPMETVVLEKTIIKIGSLLALGFGEAGAEIIGQNMRGSDSTAINAMIPGRKVEAIFGFCDIRHFTEATEVLEDQVMVFVNRIAGVVHSCIHEFFGSPNQNVGDAFLLVWRLSGHDESKQRRLADMSVISFMKIIAMINKSPLLAAYKTHPRLCKRLPNYRVRMGFGLHSGWAIEGAIGSEFKIDASYLSPNVNMASRLEGLTKYYETSMIISEVLIRLVSERIGEQARLMDNVYMVGWEDPLKLFTMDLDDTCFAVSSSTMKVSSKREKFRNRYDRLRKRQQRWSDDFSMENFFENDTDIAKMRQRFTVEFLCRFHMAYLNYEAGNWSIAHDMLEVTKNLLERSPGQFLVPNAMEAANQDGPSLALLRFMAATDNEAPKGWKG